jgi:hypothetical protein
MIIGVNRVLEHAGKQYHIQAEDLGVEQACVEVRVYLDGAVLWRKKVAYNEILQKSLPKAEQDEALNGFMEKTIHTVQAAISKGKLASG